MDSSAEADATDRYGRFWSGLRPDTTQELFALARPDLVFRDPFNELHGAAAVVAMLDHLFEQVLDVRFVVTAAARVGAVAFYRWDFRCRLRRPAIELPIAGVSEVRFDEAGLVAAHIDHWDAATQVYERLPLLGLVLRRIRGRLAFRGEATRPPAAPAPGRRG
jgi:steroid delta-isomerase